MSDTNVVVLTGRLGRDPELKYTAAGKPICSCSVAVNTGWGERKKSNWFNVVAFGKTAEFFGQYFAKGHKVTLTGSLEIDEWEKDGQKRSAPKIIINNVESHAPRQEDGQQGGSYDGGYGGGVPNDDIPF